MKEKRQKKRTSRPCLGCRHFVVFDETAHSGECWHPFYDNLPGEYPQICDGREFARYCPQEVK